MCIRDRSRNSAIKCRSKPINDSRNIKVTRKLKERHSDSKKPVKSDQIEYVLYEESVDGNLHPFDEYYEGDFNPSDEFDEEDDNVNPPSRHNNVSSIIVKKNENEYENEEALNNISDDIAIHEHPEYENYPFDQ